ncbi:MAG: phage tail assembly chaperone [Pararhizobium sp.]
MDLAEEGEAPAALLARPEIEPRLEPVWDAFFELTTDRPTGFGTGPIPFTAIHFYAERLGIEDPDAFDRFTRAIRAMDRAYLENAGGNE